jgi:DNA mismatch endonuclease (patch repair protein)
MQRQRRHDTPIELALRSSLFRRGLRYFVHRRPVKELRREADIVFPALHLAVFVDSCWWHACPEHGSLPQANREWWERKLKANSDRDRDTTRQLRRSGWTVIRVWEHEGVEDAADRIARTVAELQRVR